MQSKSCSRVAAALLLCAVSRLAWAAEPTVPYVPTPQDVVERMLTTAGVGPTDYVIDLGSGDGRIVITAAKKYGARGFGVDLNPERISESNENARKAGVTDRVAFYRRDLFETDLSQATVITMYLLPRVNLELRPRLLDLRAGTRVVSHDFSMDEWKPDTHLTMDSPAKWGGTGGKSDIYFWVIPAKVAGTWRWELTIAGKVQPYEVTLAQKFQEVTGAARVDGRTIRLQDVRLKGDDLQFSFTAELAGAPISHQFSGKVSGDSINGSVAVSGARVRGQQDWTARRAGAAAAVRQPGALHLSSLAEGARR
jgi:hypothetical protein